MIPIALVLAIRVMKSRQKPTNKKPWDRFKSPHENNPKAHTGKRGGWASHCC